MSHTNTAFHQLLKPISRHEFETLAKQHHTGHKLRSATRWDQFVGMTMSQLCGRQSLRDIESNLETQQAKLYHLGAKPIARSTLARINENQPAELYQSLFYKLQNRCAQQTYKHKFRFKNPLFSLDASASVIKSLYTQKRGTRQCCAWLNLLISKVVDCIHF